MQFEHCKYRGYFIGRWTTSARRPPKSSETAATRTWTTSPSLSSARQKSTGTIWFYELIEMNNEFHFLGSCPSSTTAPTRTPGRWAPTTEWSLETRTTEREDDGFQRKGGHQASDSKRHFWACPRPKCLALQNTATSRLCKTKAAKLLEVELWFRRNSPTSWWDEGIYW